MTRSQRMGFLGVAVVIAIVAIVVIASAGGGNGGSSGTSNAARSGTPTLTAGGVKKLTYTQGDQVRFKVKVGHPDEVHVHGYNIERELQAGKPQAIAFKATINGVFEIELHHADQQIGELTVNPK